jgi:hypothetical protein
MDRKEAVNLTSLTAISNFEILFADHSFKIAMTKLLFMT